MHRFDLFKKISHPNNSKIILLVIDGLGGLPIEDKTELEHARTPNLDSLARVSICGIVDPISPGITPGSGPAHLALFGYDPLKYEIGRGILAAAGINFPLERNDIAARINFSTIDKEGRIQDRRAGRIPTELNEKLCHQLNSICLQSVEIFVRPVKEHRAVVIFRGENLSSEITDTDPQQTGVYPNPPRALSKEAERTSQIVSKFISEARSILSSHHQANMILLRGFSKPPEIPHFSELYHLNPAAIAAYPMYKGVARLVGMHPIEIEGNSIEDEVKILEDNFQNYDFFFLHIKQADSAGEDGDWKRKVSVIEEVDRLIPRIRRLNPEVLIVTGDHSTPSLLKSHSWHPVPLLLHAPTCRQDEVEQFSEKACIRGGLGRMPAINIMSLALAHAQKLVKFGA